LITGALGYALNLLFLISEKRIVHWGGKAWLLFLNCQPRLALTSLFEA
jgi:hypothetical protein